MFLLALTREPLKNRFPSHSVVEYDCAPFVATIIADGRVCRYQAARDGFAIVETLPGPIDVNERTAFSRLEYSSERQLVRLHRSTRAGLPIYYQFPSTGELYCASHIALLRQAGVPIRENPQALPEFFVYNYVSPPRTMYEGIAQVPTGVRLAASVRNGHWEATTQESLDLPLSAKETAAVDAVCDETLALLEASFNLLMPVAQTTGMLLSGGLDSSVLFRLAQRNLGIETSYSTGFPFQSAYENLEKDYALSAAEAFGSRHLYHQVTNEDLQCAIVRSIALAEEPLLFIQPAMFLLIFSAGLPVDKEIVVSGQGADALFGLPTHHDLSWSENRNLLLAALATDPLLRLARALCRDTPENRRRLERLTYINRLSRPVADPCHVLWTFGSFGSEDWVCRHFGVRREDIIEGRARSLREFQGRTLYDLVSILAFFGEIPARKNVWSKLAEAQGKTVFYPYNEETLVRYLFSLTWDTKLTDAKAVLQGVARRLQIPDFIIDRPKSGFGVRPRHVAQVGGILEPLVPLASKVLDAQLLRSMRESAERKMPHTFWNAINYAIWKRTCIDNETPDALIEEMTSVGAVPRALQVAPH
jgi:asparagine synthetase B (glutamine-hydrolysing)